MTLQVIKSVDGKVEYVLLPIEVYTLLRQQIEQELKKAKRNEYQLFNPADYIKNPVALARINAGKTQGELAERMGVSQAYVSKIERQEIVSPKVLQNVHKALAKK